MELVALLLNYHYNDPTNIKTEINLIQSLHVVLTIVFIFIMRVTTNYHMNITYLSAEQLFVNNWCIKRTLKTNQCKLVTILYLEKIFSPQSYFRGFGLSEQCSKPSILPVHVV